MVVEFVFVPFFVSSVGQKVLVSEEERVGARPRVLPIRYLVCVLNGVSIRIQCRNYFLWFSRNTRNHDHLEKIPLHKVARS